jgi:hypothetical protein
MAAIYSVAAVPMLIAFWSVAGILQEAKICTTDDFTERGSLVGQAGDRIYLGEETALKDRRLAFFPLSQVEEVFIGHFASTATCDFGDARVAIQAAARADAASQAAREAQNAAPALARVKNDTAFAKAARGVADATGRAGLAAVEASRLVRTLEESQRQTDLAFEAGEAGDRAIVVAQTLRSTLSRFDEADPKGRERLRSTIRGRARDAAAGAAGAASAAARLADESIAEAKRREPQPG